MRMLLRSFFFSLPWIGICALMADYDAADVHRRGYCLEPKRELQLLTYKGNKYVFRLMHGRWNTPRPVAHIMNIIMQEMLGIATSMVPGSSSEAITAALAGCSGVEACKNGSITFPPEAWGAADVWSTSKRTAELNKYVDNVGVIGYTTYPGLYTFASVIQQAAEDDVMLDWWKALIFTQNRRYFTDYLTLDRKIKELGAVPGCVESDSYYVTFQSEGHAVHCNRGGWFIAPACQQDVLTCIPVILWVAAWNANEWASAAQIHNLPFAITWLGSAASNIVKNLFGTRYAFLFYWWGTDRTFDFRPLPKMVHFAEGTKPPMLRVSQVQRTQKSVWKDLARVDDSVYYLWKTMELSQDHIEDILDDLSAGVSDYDNACNWLLAHEAVWMGWLPNEMDCRKGFFYNGTYPINERCVPCAPGKYAAERGQTMCKTCEGGKYAPDFLSRNCSTCSSGRYSDPGSQVCAFCPKGEYAENAGTSRCTKCAVDRERSYALTTRQVGAQHKSDCICDVGTYSVGANAVSSCQDCPQEMLCEQGCTERSLKSMIETGQPMNLSFGNGIEPYPLLLEGFWSFRDKPFSIYKCSSHGDGSCSGRLPESCSGGHYGFLCQQCPAGQVDHLGTCQECGHATTIALVLALLVSFPLLAGAYYFFNGELYVNPTADLILGSVGGMILTTVQVCGVMGDLGVPWFKSKATSSTLRISAPFAGTDTAAVLGLECVIGQRPASVYISTVMMPVYLNFAVFIWYQSCRCLATYSKILRTWRPGFQKTANLVGTINTALFITITTLSMTPFMLFRHPSGQWSVLRYPAVLYGEARYFVMLSVSIAVWLLVIVPYITVCIWAEWSAMRTDPGGNREYDRSDTVQSFPSTTSSLVFVSSTKNLETSDKLHVSYRFLLYRFRPSCCWWANVFLLRQCLLAFAPLLPSEMPHLQVLFVSTVLVSYAAFTSAYWPWKADILNRADISQSICLSGFIISATAMIEPPEPLDDFYVYIMFSWLGLMTACLFVILGIVFVHVWRSRKSLINGFSIPVEGICVEGPPDDMADVWKQLCKKCMLFSTSELEALLRRMPMMDWRDISRAVAVWHALAPKIFPASISTAKRLKNVNHSQCEVDGLHTMDIVASTYATAVERQSQNTSPSRRPSQSSPPSTDSFKQTELLVGSASSDEDAGRIGPPDDDGDDYVARHESLDCKETQVFSEASANVIGNGQQDYSVTCPEDCRVIFREHPFLNNSRRGTLSL